MGTHRQERAGDTGEWTVGSCHHTHSLESDGERKGSDR